jgi:hypothetical protein
MKNLKLTNMLPIALGFALGYVVYKMVAKMIGDQDEVEPMLSARGSFRKAPGVQKAPTGDWDIVRCKQPCKETCEKLLGGEYLPSASTYGSCWCPGCSSSILGNPGRLRKKMI